MNNVLETYSSLANQLSHDKIVSIIVNAVIFIVILAGSIGLLFSIKTQSKGYKLLFIFYLIYWIPIFLGRDYRVKMNDAIMNDLQIVGSNLTIISTMVLTGYGFVGIFARVFADYFAFLFKYRKAFLYLAIAINIATFIPIIAIQNQYTSVIQVIGVGISASCIGSVELLFRSQFDEKKSFLTVSILSIPPLLANFLTAPIQSIVSSYAFDPITKVHQPEKLSILWIVGTICLMIAMVILIFVKENKINIVKPLKCNDLSELKNVYHFKQNSNKSNAIIYFVVIALIGAIVMFIKFSNSGSLGLLHLQKLANGNSTSYEGYLSVIFSLAQLLAGVLMGMVLIRRWKPIHILLLGCGVWIIYLVSVIFIKNPIGYFVIHSLNGFAYGILYNLLLGLVLVVSVNTVKITSMGIYQSVLSVGIATSGTFTNFMKNDVLSQKDLNVYLHKSMIVNVVLIAAVIVIIITFTTMYFCYKTKNYKFYAQHFLARKQESFKIKK